MEKVQIETAKIAKEKGFNSPTLYYYIEDEEVQLRISKDKEKYNHSSKGECYFSAPYQCSVQRWLRETHNVIIVADYHVNERKYFYWLIIHGESKEQSSYFDTWEQALELGLVRGLKLIP